MPYTHHTRCAPHHPAGESRNPPLRVDFDRRLELEFNGSKIISDAGLLTYRELDDALGLTDASGDVFDDRRTSKNGWHGMTGLIRQSIFGRLSGYEDVNDAERLGGGKYGNVAFRAWPNHPIKIVEWRRAKFLPSVVGIVYEWLRTKGYLGNVS